MRPAAPGAPGAPRGRLGGASLLRVARIGSLAVLAILPHFYAPGESRRAAVLIPLLVLFIPLLDLAWVVILRWRLGKPFHQADTNHLSHRLVRLGLSQVHSVLLIWLGAALIGAVVYFF